MGWKNVKTHFKIEHNMQITPKGLCIGSGYVHDLVIINVENGQVKENSTFSGFLKEHYPQLLAASAKDILALLKKTDNFTAAVPVFTYEGGQIIEEQAEAFGYPHTTHQGNLMYENTHFKTQKEAIKAAQQNNQSAINLTQNLIDDYHKKISELEKDLKELKTAARQLSKS